MMYVGFLEKLLKNQPPKILAPMDVPHTFAYTQDLARAMLLLAEDKNTWGEVWHLPNNESITLGQVNEIFNQILGTHHTIKVMPRALISALAVFSPPLKEVKEMLYQYDYPYVMDYSRFLQRFPDFVVTPYDTALANMVASF